MLLLEFSYITDKGCCYVTLVMCAWSDWTTTILGGAYQAKSAVHSAIYSWLVGTTSLSSHGTRSHSAAGWSPPTHCSATVEGTQGSIMLMI